MVSKKKINALAAFRILFVNFFLLSSCALNSINSDSVNRDDVDQKKVIDRFPASENSTQIFADNGRVNQINWKNLYYELLVQNLQSANQSIDANEKMRFRFLYYAEDGFNESYKKIVTSSKTTSQAFKIKNKILNWSPKISKLMNEKSELKKVALLSKPSFSQDLLNFPQDVELLSDYFKSHAGQANLQELRNYVLILVPGFGSNRFSEPLFKEIQLQMNVFHGRSEVRRALGKDARGVIDYESLESFYGKNINDGFDIVQPQGSELNSFLSSDQDAAADLLQWIVRLKALPFYQNKKIILAGYSKGYNVAMNLLVNQHAIVKDIQAVFSLAGFVQGSETANAYLKRAYDLSQSSTQNQVESFMASEILSGQKNNIKISDYLRSGLYGQSGESDFGTFAAGLLYPYLMGGNSESSRSPKPLNEKEITNAVKGISDQSTFETLMWNLKFLDDNKIDHKVSIFNLSMISNPKDMVDLYDPPTLWPIIKDDGKIDFSKMSKDHIYLFFSSSSGFSQSVAGLYDTQVSWLDSKSLPLDSRPLSHSLDPAQADRFKKRMLASGISLPENFMSIPRRKLYLELRQFKPSNLTFIDIGELRGQHWDLGYDQVFKNANIQNQFQNPFPRMAVQVSLVQLMGLYAELEGY